MKDLARDWRRWSRAERILGLLIAVTLLIGIPLAFAATASPGGGPEHHTALPVH